MLAENFIRAQKVSFNCIFKPLSHCKFGRASARIRPDEKATDNVA